MLVYDVFFQDGNNASVADESRCCVVMMLRGTKGRAVQGGRYFRPEMSWR